MGVRTWGKSGQLTPWKMDEKLKSENMQKIAVFYVGGVLIFLPYAVARRCISH